MKVNTIEGPHSITRCVRESVQRAPESMQLKLDVRC